MELHSSTVHRKLDNKLKIVGLDAHDLIFLLLFAAIMNLLFGTTVIAPYVVFVLPVLIGVILFFGKRNKPDKYLIHLFRYYLLPQSFSAANESRYEDMMKRKIFE